MRHLRPYGAGGLQAAAARQVEVQNYDIRGEHPRFFKRLQAVRGDGHSLYSVMVEVGAQGITYPLVTIDDEHPDGADHLSR